MARLLQPYRGLLNTLVDGDAAAEDWGAEDAKNK
jgi:hypothetical protein